MKTFQKYLIEKQFSLPFDVIVEPISDTIDAAYSTDIIISKTPEILMDYENETFLIVEGVWKERLYGNIVKFVVLNDIDYELYGEELVGIEVQNKDKIVFFDYEGNSLYDIEEYKYIWFATIGNGFIFVKNLSEEDQFKLFADLF